MAISTRLTDLLEIEHPVMLAGMGGVAYGALVAAVSAAGGYGCLGASTMLADQMSDEISKIREVTDQPFGVDLLTAMPIDQTPLIETMIDGGASAYVAGLGVPSELINICHDNGLLVINICGKVEHARRAVAAGCDVVIAQGTEAGGHTGKVATLPLVPQIVDAVGDQVPVVAAGGIFDGRGLAAALALGADGVWVGTRFIATPEAISTPGFKEALLATGEDGTTITRGFTGKTLRAIANDYTRYWEEHADELAPFPKQAIRSIKDGAFHLGADETATGVDPNKECYPAGQGVGGIEEILPAGELVVRFVSEAEEALSRAHKTVS